MEAAEFGAAWTASGDHLCQYPSDAIAASRLPENTKHFLLAAGLPREAAPFLCFAPDTLDWLRQPGDSLGRYYPVGSDGGGNPIVLDEDGVVWLVYHEAPSERMFVNSSVSGLAECLLAYRNLVEAAGDAFIDGRTPRHLVEAFSKSIDAVDGAAVRSETFWGEERSRLLAEAES